MPLEDEAALENSIDSHGARRRLGRALFEEIPPNIMQRLQLFKCEERKWLFIPEADFEDRLADRGVGGEHST